VEVEQALGELAEVVLLVVAERVDGPEETGLVGSELQFLRSEVEALLETIERPVFRSKTRTPRSRSAALRIISKACWRCRRTAVTRPSSSKLLKA